MGVFKYKSEDCRSNPTPPLFFFSFGGSKGRFYEWTWRTEAMRGVSAKQQRKSKRSHCMGFLKLEWKSMGVELFGCIQTMGEYCMACEAFSGEFWN